MASWTAMVNMFWDMAEQHPLLGMSPRFADHTEYTQEERARLLVVDVVLSFWINFGVAALLTRFGWATGYPQPICELWSLPGLRIDWPNLPDTWDQIMIVEPSIVSFLILSVSLAVTPFTKFISGSRFLQFAYEHEGYGHQCRQASATSVVFFWVSSFLVYAGLCLQGQLKIDHFAADRCVYEGALCVPGHNQANCTETQTRMGRIPGAAYMTSWNTEDSFTGSCETTFLNSTPWTAGVPQEGEFACFSALPFCAGAEILDYYTLKLGSTCDDPASYLTAVVISPIHLLIVDWVLGIPLLYFLGRGLGLIKKPTKPLLRLTSHEQLSESENGGTFSSCQVIKDEFVGLGLGELFASNSVTDAAGETAKTVLYIVSLGALWVAKHIRHSVRMKFCPLEHDDRERYGHSWLQMPRAQKAADVVAAATGGVKKKDRWKLSMTRIKQDQKIDGFLPTVSFEITIRNQRPVPMTGLVLRFRIARAMGSQEMQAPLHVRLPPEDVCIEATEPLLGMVLPELSVHQVATVKFVPPRHCVEDMIANTEDFRAAKHKGYNEKPGYTWWKLACEVRVLCM